MYVDLKPYGRLRKPEGFIVESANNSAILRKNPPLEGFFVYALFPEYINGEEKRGGNVSVIDADPSWSHIKYKYVRDNSRVFEAKTEKSQMDPA